MPPSGAYNSNNLPEQMDQVAVENAKKSFLQSWSEYIETIKKSTEIYERQMHLAKYEDLLADHCKKALNAMESDPASLPVPSKVEYRHLPSLIENAKSYTTNPKYAEWQSGIINALPHLEESLTKLRNLEIPAAEKDIIDSVRIAVNTPFMQVIKCKERQRELQSQLLKNADQSYAEYLAQTYTDFQCAHKERKVHQALEMVGKLENCVHDATGNFQARLDTFGEAKKLMNAAFDPIDPLNMHDYEPPHEQAVAALRAKGKEVTDTRNRWTQDLQQLKAASAEAPDSTLANLTKQADRSTGDHKRACEELDTSNSQVKQCWDALMEAQRRASDAEKAFIATKLKEEVDHQLVKDVTEQVEKHQMILEESITSSDKYCEVLKSVEKYIHGRWDPWREVVKHETKGLVTEVCEVYSISEKALGDIIDRKMSQVEHAAREEKDCLEKFHRKWEQLDPMADNEKSKALEAQKVKEHAQAEADRLSKIKNRMREVLELCRPVMEFFGIGIDTIERRALMEEWNKRRLRLYQEFEDLVEPLIVKVNVMSQTPEQEGHLLGMGKLRTVTEDELRRINGFLLNVPSNLAVPRGCADQPGVSEKQRKTAGDILVRVDYLIQELGRNSGSAQGEASARALDSGLGALRVFIDALHHNSSGSVEETTNTSLVSPNRLSQSNRSPVRSTDI